MFIDVLPVSQCILLHKENMALLIFNYFYKLESDFKIVIHFWY